MLTRPDCHPWNMLLNMSAHMLGSCTWCRWKIRSFPTSNGESPDGCALYFSSPLSSSASPPQHTHTHTHTHTHALHPREWPTAYLLFQVQLDLWSVVPSLNRHPWESLTLSWDMVLWCVFKPVEERGWTALGQHNVKRVPGGKCNLGSCLVRGGIRFHSSLWFKHNTQNRWACYIWLCWWDLFMEHQFPVQT